MEEKQPSIREIADRLEGLITRMEGKMDQKTKREVETYRSLLEETVSVLVSTKSSFHSRQLMALRKRIEAALQ